MGGGVFFWRGWYPNAHYVNIPPFIFLICTEQFWIWFSQKLTKTVKISIVFKFLLFYLLHVFRILVDTKIGSQNAVKEVLEIREKWKYPNFFSKICWKHDIPLQSLGIHYSSAFYSTLLSFFVVKISVFNYTSLFVRYFGSISRFERFVQL